MNLNKENWEIVQLGKVSFITAGFAFKRSLFTETGIPVIKIKDIKPPIVNISNCDCILTNDYLVEKLSKYFLNYGDILIAMTGATIGKVGKFVDSCLALLNQRIAKIDEKPNISHKEFIFYSISSERFIQYCLGRGASTAQQNISTEVLGQFEIVLPPLAEQKQIAELFLSLDKAIEQVEEQEKKLKALRLNLCNGLVQKNPVFGNLLNAGNCCLTKISNIADSVEQHDKEKVAVSRFVGLENIEPEYFTINTWGDIKNGTTFTKRFEAGDILFGKRRAYLKKVAVANFNGLCSSDILVLRAKKDKILPELLPFYIASESFIQHAVNTSAGSLSPRTKWKDLGEFELSIPDLETQKIILSVLQKIENTKNLLIAQKITLKKLKQNLLNEILG